jgi:WD40 repeat protein
MTTWVWRTDDWTQVAQLNGGGSNLVFSPDNSLLYTDNRLWDIATGQQVAEFPGIEWYTQQAAFSDDGTLLALASAGMIGVLGVQ